MSQRSGELPEHDDHLLIEAAEAVAARVPSRLDRTVIRTSGWLAEHTTVRLIVGATILLGALIPSIVLLATPGLTDDIQGFGYLGVFLTNLISTSTVVIPVPGLTAAGQALIIRQGGHSAYPWLVGALGGSAMGIGEVTAYYAGYVGAELARGHEIPGPVWFQRFAHRAATSVNWMMARWGMATLFVLSAVPNPFFEIAGITAGSVRMPFRRFFLAAFTGKLLRGILLAYLGYNLPFV
jgi:membrane protein DedA with SNARE-associated domain